MKMGVIDLQNYSIIKSKNQDTNVYIMHKLLLPMSQINESFPRLEKAWNLVQERGVFVDPTNTFKATVRGSGSMSYQVNLALGTCQCRDHQIHPEFFCKHLHALDIMEKMRIGEIEVEN